MCIANNDNNFICKQKTNCHKLIRACNSIYRIGFIQNNLNAKSISTIFQSFSFDKIYDEENCELIKQLMICKLFLKTKEFETDLIMINVPIEMNNEEKSHYKKISNSTSSFIRKINESSLILGNSHNILEENEDK